MEKFPTLQQLFQRYRRPGDLVFAVFFLATSVPFCSPSITTETSWIEGTGWYAQPRLVAAISVLGMVFFAALAFSELSPVAAH